MFSYPKVSEDTGEKYRIVQDQKVFESDDIKQDAIISESQKIRQLSIIDQEKALYTKQKQIASSSAMVDPSQSSSLDAADLKRIEFDQRALSLVEENRKLDEKISELKDHFSVMRDS